MVWKLLLEHYAVEIKLQPCPWHKMSRLFCLDTCRKLECCAWESNLSVRATVGQTMKKLVPLDIGPTTIDTIRHNRHIVCHEWIEFVTWISR